MEQAIVSHTARPLSATPPGRGGGVSDMLWTTSQDWTGKQVSGGLTIDLDRTRPFARLRASGVLDAITAPDFSAALLEAVAEQPVGVLIEVDDLTVTDDIGLVVFATVGAQNRNWPGCGLVMAGPNSKLHAAAERMGIIPYVPMCPDRPTALAHLAQIPVPPWQREDIAADRNAPGLARAAVANFCARQGIGGGAMGGEAAQLVASELVTNAVVHAGTPIQLTLRLLPPLLHIAVRDSGNGQARITGTVDETAESGRGLVLVDALSAAWGSFVPPIGKIVWAAIRVRPMAVVT
jgi:anti-sigma regulatory factor (Ser/Thr protein kinase)/anti-anti-sigma regulatory factor